MVSNRCSRAAPYKNVANVLDDGSLRGSGIYRGQHIVVVSLTRCGVYRDERYVKKRHRQVWNLDANSLSQNDNSPVDTLIVTMKREETKLRVVDSHLTTVYAFSGLQITSTSATI